MLVLNKKWVQHNNLYNEGAEGFNPHQKYVPATEASVVSGARKMIVGKMRTKEEALKFAKNCLSGDQKTAFLAQVAAAFGDAK
jgi:hypothetical protein